MFVDARQLSDGETVRADVCIIGAGAAGITLAREFADLRYRVAVVESGGFHFDEATQALYEGENVGLAYFPLDACRLRFFGGTTNHWGGQSRPLEEMDFEARPWVPFSGWPFPRTVLEPYYHRAQDICELGPFKYDAPDYWVRHTGKPLLPLDSADVVTNVFQFSPPTRFGRVYRTDLRRAENVVVYLNANVLEIETDPSGAQVTGLRVACLLGPRFGLSAKIYVLATGGLENARLLLLSNAAQPAGLGNAHDLVGRFFMEHLELVNAATMVLSKPDLDLRLYDIMHTGDYLSQSLSAIPRALLNGENLREAIKRKMLFVKAVLGISPAALRREQILDVVFHLWPNYKPVAGVESFKRLSRALGERDVPEDLGGHIANILGDLDHVADLAFRRISGASTGLFNSPKPFTTIDIQAASEQAPNPDSRVTLSQARDAFGQNRLRLDWRVSPIGRTSILRATEILAREVGRTGLGRVRIALDDPDRAWPDEVEGQNHHLGTTRMSDDPKSGVVDADCRVHTVSNLYVAGSSVFPAGGFTNPTLTIVALALRLANHIKAKLV